MMLAEIKRFLRPSRPFQTKIRLADNQPLSDTEYQLACKLCDILAAVSAAANQERANPPEGGVFWENANDTLGPFSLHLRKDRKEIDHSFLMNTRFRDFPTIAYEFDGYTPAPDFWVQRYKTLAPLVPAKWRAKIPARFGETGWNFKGYPINRLTGVNQERILAMYLAGITQHLEQKPVARMLEIGAGGGEMGYILCKALPRAAWFNCDLIGSLAYAAIHLAILLPEKRHYIYVGNLPLPSHIDERLVIRSAKEASALQDAVINIPNFLLDDFQGELQLDFAYNTYSFGEMPSQAVAHYVRLLSGFLKKQGVLFEQNGYFPDRGGDNPENMLSSAFKQFYLPQQIDGRWFLGGPMRFWCNNDADTALSKISHSPNMKRKLPGMIAVLNEPHDCQDLQRVSGAWDELKKLCPKGL
jgi:hypothetical protein